MHEQVKTYLVTLPKWNKELTLLRTFVLALGLSEEFKWKHPCYTDQGKNIVILQEFKNYCAVLFPKGVLLNDSQKILVKMTENVQSDRQIRFTSLEQIQELETTIKDYIVEAIGIERDNKKVTYMETKDFPMPVELLDEFDKNPDFKEAFYQLTPGRQRGYLLVFNAGKFPETRNRKIEENKDRIMDGKGISDCVCGHSKRMPNCDGSHKHYE